MGIKATYILNVNIVVYPFFSRITSIRHTSRKNIKDEKNILSPKLFQTSNYPFKFLHFS